MNRNTAIALMMFASSALATAPALAADPSLHEVYQAAGSGRLKQAESMMDQVLRDHPNSAKAHFVDAQILAREGRLDMARAELGTAERLEPGLPFARPESVQELRGRVAGAADRLAPATVLAASRPAGEFPWGMLIVGALLVAAVIFFVRALNRPRIIPAAGGAAGYGIYAGPGGMPGQPYGAGPVAGSGMGSGILGGLATGAAMGAGVVAGEALMNRILGGGSQSALAQPAPLVDNDAAPAADYDLGGSDFGVSDASSWDDSTSGGSDDWS